MRAIVETGANASKGRPMARSISRKMTVITGAGIPRARMAARMNVPGCAIAAMLTTAATRGSRLATSSAAPAPTECPTRVMHSGSTRRSARSHPSPASMSSAKRGIEVNRSSSLRPWQQASRNSACIPAAWTSGAIGNIKLAAPFQPWMTSTAGRGRSSIGQAANHPLSMRPFDPGIVTSSAISPKSPGSWSTPARRTRKIRARIRGAANRAPATATITTHTAASSRTAPFRNAPFRNAPFRNAPRSTTTATPRLVSRHRCTPTERLSQSNPSRARSSCTSSTCAFGRRRPSVTLRLDGKPTPCWSRGSRD